MKRLLNIKNRAIFHIIGIGGIGMSGIAEILHNLGYYVQGSDLAQNYNTERLKNLGIEIFHNHDSANINGAHFVVISTDIKPTNVEYIAAKESHIPIIKRAEMLAEIMKMKTCISISGSHGKTTTTSIVASVFEAADLQPTVINGGIINTKSTNAYVGTGEYLVVEADESDATFIKVPSTIGVITNIDPEHLDYYGSFEKLYEAFTNFIHNLPFYGFAVCCADHPITKKLANEIIDRKVITYGIDAEDAHIKAYNIRTGIDGSYFDVKINLPKSSIKYTIEGLYLAIPGKHNILNSLSAIAIGIELDFGIKAIKEGLENFKGVKRRFTKTGEVNGIKFIDDYAHHPEEIKATLATARSVLPQNSQKVVTIFQPHRYSRLANLFEDFASCFTNADEVYIAPVYSAGEAPVNDYDSTKLAKRMQENFPNKIIKTITGEDDLVEIVKTRAKAGDLILFLGAGNITYWAYNLPAKLTEKNLVA